MFRRYIDLDSETVLEVFAD